MSSVHSLSGIVLAVKGTEFALFRNKQEVEDFARDAGAKVMKNLSKSVTHMVVANGSATMSSGKGGCIVVDESWLRSNVLAFDPSAPRSLAPPPQHYNPPSAVHNSHGGGSSGMGSNWGGQGMGAVGSSERGVRRAEASRWWGQTQHCRKRLKVGLLPLPAKVSRAVAKDLAMQTRIAPLVCARCALCLESGLPKEVQWALDTISRLSATEDLSLQAAPGLAEALAGVITRSWDTDQTEYVTLKHKTDVLHDAIRRKRKWGEHLEPNLGMEQHTEFSQSWIALTVLRNLSFVETNSAILASVMCAPVTWDTRTPLLASLLHSQDDELKTQARIILCNIAKQLPDHAVWGPAALEKAITAHCGAADCDAAELLGGCVSALCRIGSNKTLFSAWAATASIQFFDTLCTLWKSSQGVSDNEQLCLVMLELVFLISELSVAVRRSLAGALLCIPQLVVAVGGDPLRSTAPQCAAAALCNLCQSKDVCERISMDLFGQLLTVACSSKHAEIASRVLQVVELVYGSHNSDKQAEEEKKKKAQEVDLFKEQLLKNEQLIKPQH